VSTPSNPRLERTGRRTAHHGLAAPGIEGPGLVVTPTFAGAELFMWAIGSEDPDAHKFSRPILQKFCMRHKE